VPGPLLLALLLACLMPSMGAAAPQKAGVVNRGGHFNVVFYGPGNVAAAHLISLVLEEAYRKVGADLLFWPSGRLGVVL